MEVHIDKGMRDGQKIVIRGEGDQAVCITFSLLSNITLLIICFMSFNILSSSKLVQPICQDLDDYVCLYAMFEMFTANFLQ